MIDMIEKVVVLGATSVYTDMDPNIRPKQWELLPEISLVSLTILQSPFLTS